MPEQVGEVTQLLHQWRAGAAGAENELFNRLNPDLRRLAHYLMKGERKGHTLQATELVDQIYMRLIAAKDRDWQNRQHFFALAGRAMRRYLIDHARGRPPGEFVGLTGVEALLPAGSVRLDLAITVNRLLDELAESQPKWCQLVELKYFLGLTDEEAAEVLGMKLRTVQRMWYDVRKWLFKRAESEDAKAAATS
ncbi:MAG TPA: ECF-type sigma factor [Bryobacteraceae bacterium]